MHIEVVQANLGLMGALLNSDDDNCSHLELFKALREVFACDQAILLENHGDDLECIASAPGELVGRRWARDVFQDVLSGRILAGNGGNETQEFARALSDLISPAQPFLCLPSGVRGRPGALVLLRANGKAQFGDGSVAIARQCAVVSLGGAGGAKRRQTRSRTRASERTRRAIAPERTERAAVPSSCCRKSQITCQSASRCKTNLAVSFW